jgi:hypothetical protein
MAVAKPSIDARVRSVAFAEDSLVVMLRDGREIRAPSLGFPGSEKRHLLSEATIG